MKKRLLVILAVVVVLWIASTSYLTVDPTVFAYVTQLGEHVATYDGGDNDNDTGLHFRMPWPVQSVQRIDRRLQVFDLTGIELLTRAKDTIDQTLTIDAYVCWRIVDKDGVDLFIRKVGSTERARTLLEKQISSDLAAAVGKMSMGDLVSVAPGKVDAKLKELRDGLLVSQNNRVSQKERIRKEYGIQIEDIRLRRLSYPVQVRQSIFDRIRTERDIQAAKYRRDGTTEAERIKSEAEKAKRIIVAEARAKAGRLKGEAIAEGDRIRNQAHGQEREFYMFLRKLEDYARILGESKAVLYLSTQREMFDLLLGSPGAGAKKPAGTAGKDK
jgi:membrane protease subunit HflC